MTASYLWLWNGSAFIKAECDANGYIKVVEQNLDAEGLIQQSAHHKGYNYGTSEWDKVGITANHELKVAMTGLDDYILKSLFNANTIIYATADDTPVALTLDEQRILGRITGGNIAALTQTQIFDFINSAGDIPSARMSANIIAAIAGLDPTFTSLTFDGANAIFRNVNNSFLLITSGTAVYNGAGFELYGGDHVARPGYARIDMGDYRAGATPNSKFELRYLSNGTSTIVLVVDKVGNVTTSGVYDDTVTGTANVIVSAGGHLQRATSNEKDKKNIRCLNIDTARVFQLPLRIFTWEHKITELREAVRPGEDKGGKIIRPERIVTKEHVGLIAEEVEAVFSEAASHNIETDEPDGIEWNTIIVALLAEVTKLRNEVNELKGAKT